MATTITIPTIGPRARWLAVAAAATALLIAAAAPAFSPRAVARRRRDQARPHDQRQRHRPGHPRAGHRRPPARRHASSGRTVKAARADAAKAMTAVIAALKKLGIADADIQTSSITLQPAVRLLERQRRRASIGYQFSNSVAVTVRKLDVLGDAIDDALAAGATTLDSVPSGSTTRPRPRPRHGPPRWPTRRPRPTALASAAGVSIEGVSSISETVGADPVPDLLRRRGRRGRRQGGLDAGPDRHQRGVDLGLGGVSDPVAGP